MATQYVDSTFRNMNDRSAEIRRFQHRDTEGDLALITIHEISKIVDTCPDPGVAIRSVLNILATQLQMRRCTLSLVQSNGDLRTIWANGLAREQVDRGHYQSGEGIIGKIVKTGLPVVVPSIFEEPLFLNRTQSRDWGGTQPIAYPGIPIKLADDTVGVLSVDREMNTFGGSLERDVRLLKIVASLISRLLFVHRQVEANAESANPKPVNQPRKPLPSTSGVVNVIGASREMQEVLSEVQRAAVVQSTVLIRGESGTGKEVIAHAVHQLSPRRDGPFIRVNCGALSESLLESELFGHEKGAFTGALAERKGRFELADSGTLFLDEIGEISPSFQVRLLRVLQEREFERVGGSKSIKVDVRLIAATNSNLEEAVKQGTFRADLYFRINVISIFLPALRERREDIPELVSHFLERFNRNNERQLELSPEAMKIMQNCHWPGNVRELENCVERTAAMSRGKTIQDINLACQTNTCFSKTLVQTNQNDEAVGKLRQTPAASSAPDRSGAPQAPDTPMGDLPLRDRVIWAMEECGWVQAKAARLLGLTTRQVNYALEKYRIEIKKF